ncbi:peroxiredoxin-like 2A isoform X2 [Chelonia mydas]|uniref:peroxiredoxin-like 2A isoform X2 n=1 Tax=Chelonia mydas TaxID=8469 RepID=UPI0018A1FE9A|nr:peroxiredoxin-like 2A isoform X2 [Chelonia mydas]
MGSEMSSLPDLELFTMGMWSIGLGAIGVAVTGILLANTDLFLSKPEVASLEFLETTELKSLGEEERTFKAGELWKKNGAVIMAVRRPGCFLCREEASELSSLKPQLDQLGIPLYAVVKEKIGTEVEDFQHYFKGEIFLDEKKKFYGPHKRKMLLMGFIRLGVWQNFLRAWKNGYSGNLEGEGFILGGVYVIGAGKQGVLLEHREREFGDKVILQSVLDAAEKIKPQAADTE